MDVETEVKGHSWEDRQNPKTWTLVVLGGVVRVWLV